MSQQQPATVFGSPDQAGSSSVFETPAYRNAIVKLSLAFEQGKHAVAVTAEGQSAARYVLRRFVESLDANVTVIWVSEPSADVMDLMRHLIRAIGFEPRELGVVDLDKVFRMFLAFQKSHGQRTILCVEQTGENNAWILDKLRDLIEKEQNGAYGLFTVLTGQPDLMDLLSQGPLGKLDFGPGTRIALPPFTKDETLQYVRRRVEASGRACADQFFSGCALALLQELTHGVPDAVAALTNRALELAGDGDVDGVTHEQVQRAHASLRLPDDSDAANQAIQAVTGGEDGPARARLIVSLSDDDVRELALEPGRLLIGRSQLCDVRVDGPTVSRHHALIDFAADGAATLVDLSSTNGTFVDGGAITEHALRPGETIVVGNCRIEYLFEDVQETPHPESATVPDVSVSSGRS